MSVYIVFLITFWHFTASTGLTVATRETNVGKIMTAPGGNQNQPIPGGVFNSGQATAGPTQGGPNGQSVGYPQWPAPPAGGGQQSGGPTPTYGTGQQGEMTGSYNGFSIAGPTPGMPGGAGGQQIGTYPAGGTNGQPPASVKTGGGPPLALLIAVQIPPNNWIAAQSPSGANGIPTEQLPGTTSKPTAKDVTSSSTENIPSTTGTSQSPGIPTTKELTTPVSNTASIPGTISTSTPDAEWITPNSSTTVTPKDSNNSNTNPLNTSSSSTSENIMVNPSSNPVQPITKESVGSFERQCEDVNQQIRVKRAGQFQITVVGGQNSMEREFPHMAALGYGSPSSKQWLCGGSLLSENYVITAGHCLSSANLGEVQYVKLGTIDILQNSPYTQEFTVIRKIPHPAFNGQTLYNDIALLQLERAAEITQYISPICLWNSGDLGNRILEATGWGRIDTAGQTSQTLQKVSLELYSQAQCQQAYSTVSQQQLPVGIQENNQICAGSQNGRRDTCQGDSGGPLQVRSNQRWYLVGITSFGIACGTTIPGVYTRISPYKDWIQQVIWNQ